jgi:5-methyltetrahydropteroyltriglutamate--homocysteine methyltransferase
MTKILTTHVGSLPRTQDVVDFIFAREHETPYSQAEFDACMTKACDETVRRQVDAGIDIVSDGETSKISYATYVKDRYTGFSGDSPRNAPGDLKLFPGFLQRLADDGGTPQYARPMCTGEVTSKGQGELKADIANLQAGMARKRGEACLYECRLSGGDFTVSAKSALQDERSLSGSTRRCDESRI